MSLLPALDDTEKHSSHGWSAANRFNNADEEICYKEDNNDQNSQVYHPAQSPVSQNTSQLKQQLLQQQQQHQQQQQQYTWHQQQQQGRQQVQQQQVKQPARNFIQQPATSKSTKVLYSIVHSAGTQQQPQVGNQQQLKNTVNQQHHGQIMSQQNISQSAGQVQIQNTNLARQKFAAQGHSQHQQHMVLKGNQQVGTDPIPDNDEEELNRKIQLQAKEIEENQRMLMELGMTVQMGDGQKQQVGKCNYVGSVKVPNAAGHATESSTSMRQLLMINSSQANNRKIVNNNGATFSNSLRTTPQTPGIVSPSECSGATSQTNQMLGPGPRKHSQVNMKGNSMLINQKQVVGASQTLVQDHSVSSNQNQQAVLGGNHLAKEKVALEGGGQFNEGEAYLIRSKDGQTRKMVLKNGAFVPFEETNMIQHSKIDSSQRGRGRGNRGRQTRGRGRGRGTLQGNATGVNMVQTVRSPNPAARHPGMPGPRNPAIVTSPSTRPSILRQDFMIQRAVGGTRARMPSPVVIHTSANQVTSSHAPGQTLQRPPLHLQNLMPPAQVSKVSGIESPQLARRPLHADGQAVEGTMNDIGVCAEPGTSSENIDTQELPQVPSDPSIVAVCQFCGYKSTDKVKCESCSRKFTSATKFIKSDSSKEDPDAKRRKLEVTKDGTGAIIDKKIFYKNKLEEQNQVYSDVFNSSNNATSVLRTTRVLSRGARSRGRMRGRPRGRGGHIIVPETVTISSDEEESTCDKTPTFLTQPGTPQSSQTSQASTDSKPPSSAECPESPLIPTIPISAKRPFSGRVQKMEDETGTSQTSRERSPSPSQVLINAKTVRVGTFKGGLIEPIVVNKDGLGFFIEGEKSSHKFHIYPQEIQQCLVKFDNQSLLFFLTSPSCGTRTRKDLGIPQHVNTALAPPEPYFDPSGIDMTHQMITVMMDALEKETQVEFQKYMESFKSMGKQGDEAFYMELSPDEAHEILKQSTKKTANQQLGLTAPAVAGDHQYSQAGEEDRNSRSPTPPRGGFAGPIIKLLTYPPPPSKGALTITNEDLYCLHEGEFLNDVIIDFYLRYLLLERLSAEDRARTHVFSSFFYKRLTQRIRGAAIDDDPNVTLAYKRHARVKTWTRHVNLFEKDFIIIPINEHAHWFLAIVCFPGLVEPVENNYIPKPLTMALPETASVPTPPQPSEEPTQEEMETDEAETSASQTSKDNSQTAAASETPNEERTEKTEEHTEKPEVKETEVANKEPEEEKQTQEQEPVTGSEEAGKEQEVNGSEQAGSQESEDPAKETTGSESVEEKQDAPAEQNDKPASDETAETPETTASTSVGTDTGPCTSTSSENTNSQQSKPILIRVGSRGKAVSKEEEGTAETVARGIKQPCVIVFDSLSGPSRSRIVQVLKEYLQVEWAAKKGGDKVLNKTLIKGCVPKVPQQNNYSDCGVYLLQYVESFFEDPIQDFNIPIKGLHDWFSVPKIEKKREELKDLIIELKEKFESPPENKDSAS